jgi:hypothetical protein
VLEHWRAYGAVGRDITLFSRGRRKCSKSALGGKGHDICFNESLFGQGATSASTYCGFVLSEINGQKEQCGETFEILRNTFSLSLSLS